MVAIILMAFGVSLVVYSGTTGGPFELLMLAGEDRGMSRLTVRYCLDVGVFVSGVALGGTFGPAIVVYALTFGLVLQLVSQGFHDHAMGRQQRIQIHSS
ncbi:MAG: putative membrane protein YczE [Candidatus Poriferisodalaceae bacterium]|jgi:uncharacterized membrane protein YczE